MALAYQSQTFQNILKDFENITNEEDRKKHLSSLDVSPHEFITAVKGYRQAKDNEQDIRPYDGGLSIGSARYIWHHILGNPRINREGNASSYLGAKYDLDDIK